MPSKAANLIALADTLRHTAYTMFVYGCSPAAVQQVRDGADECDRAAFMLVRLTVEAAA